jgi:ubiquinol-cytochrome c reductase cytochrome b subunit
MSLVRWIDDRFPLSHFVKSELTGYQTPANLNYWWNFGSLAGFILVLQIVTGLFLSMHYKADASLAFDSVDYIMREVNYGWLIRYLHAAGATAFFVVIYIHILRGIYCSSYRRPREVLWWSGLALLLLIMGAAFMGYLLPWGQMSYWGAQVITNLFGTIPLIGDDIVILLRGDFTVGDATLTRFFALHYMIPFLIVFAVGLHLVTLHWVKSTNPSGYTLQRESDTIPFHPFYTVKDMFGLMIFLVIFCALVFFKPGFFMEAENFIPANPLQTPAHIVPEWYFLPFYAILRAVPNLTGGVVAMVAAILILAFLPYLDRSRIPGGAINRPIFRFMFLILAIDVVVLTYIGAQPPEGAVVLVGQGATLIYFAFFALLPWVSKWEERWLLSRSLPNPVKENVDKTVTIGKR